MKDDISGHYYYVDIKKQETTWQRPRYTPTNSPSLREYDTPPPPPPSSHNLPPGWEMKVDPASKRKYYIDHINRTSTWIRPTQMAQLYSERDFSILILLGIERVHRPRPPHFPRPLPPPHPHGRIIFLAPSVHHHHHPRQWVLVVVVVVVWVVVVTWQGPHRISMTITIFDDNSTIATYNTNRTVRTSGVGGTGGNTPALSTIWNQPTLEARKRYPYAEKNPVAQDIASWTLLEVNVVFLICSWTASLNPFLTHTFPPPPSFSSFPHKIYICKGAETT